MGNLASVTEPPINYSSQGAVACKQILVDPKAQVWILNCSNLPAPGEGNGWAGPGTLAIDHTLNKLYMQTGTLAATVWTAFANASSEFSSATALTAHSGGGKGSALALTAQINNVTTVAATHDSVLAPPATAGAIAVITNSAANTMDIYGQGTDTINATVTANPTSLEGGGTIVLWSPVAGKWYGGPYIGSVAQSQPSTPTAPNSTSVFTMMGLAGAITPKKSGTLMLTISGNLTGTTTTAGDGIAYQLSYGTGTAPTTNAALAGTQVGSAPQYTNPTTVTAVDIQVPFSITAVITGLTLGTAYWLDLAAKALNTASHVNFANLSISVIEL